MKPYQIAYLAGGLPLLSIHLCYLLAAINNHVPLCIPYIHSCTSISSTGRIAPEYTVFKCLMIPAAIVIAIFWVLVSQWILALKPFLQNRMRYMLVMGIVASVGLFFYTLALGKIGDEFRMQRRVGVILFYALTFINQCLLCVIVSSIFSKCAGFKSLVYGMFLIIFAVFLFAVSAVVISSYNSQVYDSIEDAFEWWVTLLQCLFVLVLATIWKKDYHYKNE